MMQPIVFITQMFADTSEQEMLDSRLKLLVYLEALTSCNVIYLKSHPHTPKLYDSDVTYQPEFGTEEWQDIPTTLERGFGDCEDLAAFRCAELRFQGIEAVPHIRWRMVDGAWRFHALLKWPDKRGADGKIIPGRIEDPSLRLGMRKWSFVLSAPKHNQF